MRIIAVIDQPAVSEKHVIHHGLWSAHGHSPPEAAAA